PQKSSSEEFLRRVPQKSSSEEFLRRVPQKSSSEEFLQFLAAQVPQNSAISLGINFSGLSPCFLQTGSASSIFPFSHDSK
ncbi:MAG: hypothetical protein KGO82_08795, partial [Bacteroidota bacterium]|nr:hypothetical protein [Bacteroidota bacterium]